MVLRGKLLQGFVFCGGVLIVYQSGFNLGWPSYALPQLLSNSSSIPITDDEGSWIASMFLIGGMLGSLLTAVTLDVFGRRTMFLVTSLPVCGVWLIIAFAQTSAELYVARLLGGITDGVVSSCLPMFIAETCNPKIRGLLITSTQVIFYVGVFMANLLGSFLSNRVVALMTSALSLAGGLSFIFIPETPHFYVIKGDAAKARDSIKRFYGGTDADVENLLNSITDSLNKSKKKKWWELFTDARNRKSIFIIIVSRLFQQFSGFMGITFYAQTLFRKTEGDVNPVAFVSVFSLLQITIMLINAIVVDKIGRRPLLIASASVVAVALFIVSVYFILENVTELNVSDYSWFPIFGLFLYIIGFTVGLQSVIFLLVNEIFPLHVKTCAVSVFTITYDISATAVSKFFQYTKDEFGLHVPFIVFTISTMCAVPFLIFCIPETKRKTLEEIQNQMQSKTKSKIKCSEQH